MNFSRCRFLSPLVLGALLLAGCSGSGSSVSLVSGGRHFGLFALNPPARDGILSGPETTAWFRFEPSKLGLSGKQPVKYPRTLEVVIAPMTGNTFTDGSATVTLAFVTPSDLDVRKALVKVPAARSMSVVRDVNGALHLGMVIPLDTPVCGFAVAVKGSDNLKARVVSASIRDAESGWNQDSAGFHAGFGPEGGSLSVGSASFAPIDLPVGSLITVAFSPKTGKDGETIATQKKILFSAGTHTFGFRRSNRPATVSVPAFLATDGAAVLRVSSGGSELSGVLVSWNRKYSAPDASDVNSPISADPHMIIEWNQRSWRRTDRELFSWDRFPTVLIFDTANYDVQDRYFKRLAFFVEKKGWRGKLWADADIANQHAYFAHDYRADSLAEFFSRAASERFPLNDQEKELRGILLAEGVIRKDGSGFAAGAGAVLSISRESAGYLRYLFMAHEGYHGIYFTDPDFRAKVKEVYQSMDKRAIDYLQGYFTVVESLGYDTTDPYLMENELMAYLMQQPLDRVGTYFSENISERYMRHGGNRALNDWIVSTHGAEFTRAASELNEYAFTRWGIAGGRVGLFWSDR